MDKFDEKAREIRRRYFPWDEYPHIAAPGGIADQMQEAIAQALRDVAHEGYERGYQDGELSRILVP